MRRIPVAGISTLKGWGMNTLTQDDLEQIHAATLDVLQSTGIYVDHDEALSILEKGGCWVNKKTKVVRFRPTRSPVSSFQSRWPFGVVSTR